VLAARALEELTEGGKAEVAAQESSPYVRPVRSDAGLLPQGPAQ
jgi:hypothetical protein